MAPMAAMRVIPSASAQAVVLPGVFGKRVMTCATMPLVRPLWLAFVLAAAPICAAEARPQPSFEAAATSLKPGQFIWRPENAADGPVKIVVSLPLQRAFVLRGGVLIGVSTVSTGQPGYDTPAGTFTILEKQVDHRSTLYDDAPMPYMQRLTWDGVALHAGKVTGLPESHGCIRLPLRFAKILYAATPKGATVIVTDEAYDPADGEGSATLPEEMGTSN
jgi:lipoprotein-anchoring transpeptidase ErfK/SrfK